MAETQKEKNRNITGNLNASHLPNFSGNWSNGSNAGVFQLNVNNATSNSNTNVSGQQMYVKKLYRSNIALPLGKI